MFILVFNETDREKMMLKGANYISEQNINGKKAFLFDIGQAKNFDLSDIKYIPTKKIYF